MELFIDGTLRAFIWSSTSLSNTDKSNNKTNIIYKPIFFKTNKLNNLQIKYLQND